MLSACVCADLCVTRRGPGASLSFDSLFVMVWFVALLITAAVLPSDTGSVRYERYERGFSLTTKKTSTRWYRFFLP